MSDRGARIELAMRAEAALQSIKIKAAAAAHVIILLHLSRGPASMSELAKACNHTTAAATGMIDRLEAIGWVARRGDLSDRRVVLVALAPRGQQTLDSYIDTLTGGHDDA